MSPQEQMTTNQKIDWQKVILALSTGAVFILQQWHAMKLEDLKQQVVPRHEFDRAASKVMDKDEILAAMKMINARMDIMEVQRGSNGK